MMTALEVRDKIVKNGGGCAWAFVRGFDSHFSDLFPCEEVHLWEWLWFNLSNMNEMLCLTTLERVRTYLSPLFIILTYASIFFVDDRSVSVIPLVVLGLLTMWMLHPILHELKRVYRRDDGPTFSLNPFNGTRSDKWDNHVGHLTPYVRHYWTQKDTAYEGVGVGVGVGVDYLTLD